MFKIKHKSKSLMACRYMFLIVFLSIFSSGMLLAEKPTGKEDILIILDADSIGDRSEAGIRNQLERAVDVLTREAGVKLSTHPIPVYGGAFSEFKGGKTLSQVAEALSEKRSKARRKNSHITTQKLNTKLMPVSEEVVLRMAAVWTVQASGVRPGFKIDRDFFTAEVIALESLDQAQPPNDPFFGLQWGLHNTGQTVGMNQNLQTDGVAGFDVDALAAWEITTGDPDVVVAVLDLGVNFDAHSDLHHAAWLNQAELASILPAFPGLDADGDGFISNEELLSYFGSYQNARLSLSNGIDGDGNGHVDDFLGWNFVSNNNNVLEISSDNHGTLIASIIGAEKNNSEYMAGLAPNIKIMALKVGTGPGIAYDNLAKGVEYAVNNGADIISISTSTVNQSSMNALLPSLEYAFEAGVVIVSSAGNTDNSTPRYPAAWNLTNSNTFVLGTGAVMINGQRYTSPVTPGLGSSYGPWVDIAAPGFNVIAITNNGSLAYTHGTSNAVPFVAAAAALLKSEYPCLTNVDISNFLLAGSSPLETDEPLGAGMLSAYGALSMVESAGVTCGEPVSCPADLNGDGHVNVADLLDLLGSWGPCQGCAADINGDGAVNVSDLLELLAAWGPCPVQR